MVFVVDPYVVAGWFLPDERTETSDALALRMQSEDAIVPDLFWHEARSLLLAALRRGRIPEAAVYMSLDRLSTIPLRNAGMSDATSTTRLAIKHGLSAYDLRVSGIGLERTGAARNGRQEARRRGEGRERADHRPACAMNRFPIPEGMAGCNIRVH